MRAPHTCAVLWCLTLGCGHAPTPDAKAAAPARAPRGAEIEPRDPRVLSNSTRFEELTAAMASLDGAEPTGARCLLARRSHDFRFEGDVAVAVRPVPRPPLDLDRELSASTSVRVLSRYGSLGQGPFAIAALTDTPPARAALVLVLTDHGMMLLDTERPASEAVDGDALAARLRAREGTPLFVTAEADVPLERVYAALELLIAHTSAPVGLAVALGPDVALPVANIPPAPRCPEGLPAAAGVLEGDLAMDELRAGLAPLRARAPDCLLRADARGAAGGRVTLAFRVAPDGSVSDACIEADETDDAALEHCLLALTRELRFAPPNPAGVVDAELPLVLRSSALPAQEPICTNAK